MKISTLLNGYLELMFPHICACCSEPLADEEQALCEYCKNRRFEPSDSSLQIQREILPEFLSFRIACWQLEPGDPLQQLIYRLKYEHLYSAGVDLGKMLGSRLMKNEIAGRHLSLYEPFLVPVPLHRSRRRKRGYNQARAICEGVRHATGWYLPEKEPVHRLRRTDSQTGLTREERKRNISGAFTTDLTFLPYEMPVVVDDVFTTGATVMEVAAVLLEAGARRVGIATLAEA